jgi:uncharacterized membrane protein
MDDARVAAEVAAIHARLAALARDPGRAGVAAEIGSIRAQLRELAETNAEVGDRLAESLGLRQPRDP